MDNKLKLSKEQIIRQLWIRGNLSYKCHVVQKEMYDIFYKSPKHSTLVWLLSRQTGKSYMLVILALEQAFREKNSVIKILTDTKGHAQNIFDPIFKMLLDDCPEDLKPKYISKDYAYHFTNGSVVQLAGSDSGHYEKLRGQKSALVLVDEAGFCDKLNHIVTSVLFPTTTHTGGRIVLASTPSPDIDHDFHRFVEEAELKHTLTKKTLFDNPLLDEEAKQMIIEKMGGVNSNQFRREYLCELLKNETSSVLPEFNDELAKEVTKEWPKPPFRDSYVAMDLGGKDLTAVLFGYYDFRGDKVVIEDELLLDFSKAQNTIEKLTNEIIQKETLLFTDHLTNEKQKPYMRVSDINYMVIGEILKYSNNELSFSIPRKDDKTAAVNDLRVMLTNKKIIINPKCKTLIRHLKNVKWNSDKSKFKRSPDDGHYDTVDALIYFIRSISYSRNPYPQGYGLSLKNMHFENKTKVFGNVSETTSQAAAVFQRILNRQNSKPEDRLAQIFGFNKKKEK